MQVGYSFPAVRYATSVLCLTVFHTWRRGIVQCAEDEGIVSGVLERGADQYRGEEEAGVSLPLAVSSIVRISLTSIPRTPKGWVRAATWLPADWRPVPSRQLNSVTCTHFWLPPSVIDIPRKSGELLSEDHLAKRDVVGTFWDRAKHSSGVTAY